MYFHKKSSVPHLRQVEIWQNTYKKKGQYINVERENVLNIDPQRLIQKVEPLF